MKNYPSFSNSLFLRDWVQRVFPNSQAVSLAILLVLGFVLIYTLSDWLLPVFAAGVIAYLLEGIVQLGERENLPRLASVFLVYFTFLAFVTFMITVDYACPVEFRSPIRASILVPYLGLFFGAIFLPPVLWIP